MRRSIWILGVVSLVLGVACPKPPPPPASEPAPDPSHFSGQKAWKHLETLVEIGPRVSGTGGAESARTYIRMQLELLGLAPEPLSFVVQSNLDQGEQRFEYESLLAVIPGESDDIVVLAAPFDSTHFESFTHLGANNGASGAALLLELARVLKVDPLPYTVWLAFLDGEAERTGEAGPSEGLLGSRALVDHLQAAEALSRLRLVVYFNQVADRDLVIARDLRSDRIVRRSFERAARELGYESAFPGDRPFSRPAGGHVAFYAVGFRRVLAVIDDAFGGDEAPGAFGLTEEDTLERCDSASLEIVGQVTNAGLRDVAELLRKVDRFSRRPVPAPQSDPAEPGESTGPPGTTVREEAPVP